MMTRIYRGSHNTMSYLPPAKWWMLPFRFMAKCQTKPLIRQINEGVLAFDLRVSRYNGRWYFAHGLMRFEFGAYHSVFSVVRTIARHTDLGERPIVRIILEYINADSDTEHFIKLCEALQYNFPRCIFIGGRAKSNWEKLFEFKEESKFPDRAILQPVSSMMPDARWYERFIPILYHRRMSRQVPPIDESTRIILSDFI